jgi:hypothetical protein
VEESGVRIKSVLGVIGALVPLCYCGGLLYYFFDLSGSSEQIQKDGLGPTMLGLGVVGLLFCIPFIMKIARLFAGPHSPASGGPGDTFPRDGGFDADAVVARYLARQSEQAARDALAPPTLESGGLATRPSFGRKPADK